MNKSTILMFSMSSFCEWQRGIRNRNFFILRELINRSEIGRVIMVNYLPWNFKRMIKELLNQKSKISPRKLSGQENQKDKSKFKNIEKDNLTLHYGGQAIEQFNNSSLTVYKDFTSKLSQINEKLFVYSAIDPFFSKQTFIKKLKNILISQYPNIPISKLILWSYYPLFIDYYTQIPSDLKIFDAVDDWRAHPAYVKQKDLLDNNYQKIKQQADIIFTVSRYLKESLFASQENVYVVTNGADIAVQSSKFKVQNFNSKFKINNSKSIIGYVGNIQNRIDFQLIKFLVQKNPDKLFVFAGKVWTDVYSACCEIKKFKNIQFIGQVSNQNLPELISQFAVAIVPHKINNLTKSMDPMKIYEYLSCGLPVVSSAVIDPTNFAGLVDIAKSYEEFNQKINQNLDKKQDIIFKQQALAFMQKNTWEKRAGEMMEIIGRYNLQ